MIYEMLFDNNPLGVPDVDVSGFLNRSKRDAEKVQREKYALHISRQSRNIALAALGIALASLLVALYSLIFQIGPQLQKVNDNGSQHIVGGTSEDYQNEGNAKISGGNKK
jgi:hypothetical protein